MGAAERGKAPGADGAEGGHLVIDQHRKDGRQAGIEAERAEGVCRKETVEGARHPAGGTVEPHEVEGADEPGVEHIPAVKEQKGGRRREEGKVDRKIKKKRTPCKPFSHFLTPPCIFSQCVLQYDYYRIQYIKCLCRRQGGERRE